MRTNALVVLAALAAAIPAAGWSVAGRRAGTAPAVAVQEDPGLPESAAAARRRADVAAMDTWRPGYPFWQHVFTMPDWHIAFGSALDGRLLVVFPTRGNWLRDARWEDPALRHVLDGQTLARDLRTRREQVARLLEPLAGPVVHNATRGDALLPNVRRYGSFVGEWAAIYERFGVPADIGLGQVILESGLHATRRSEAHAVGFCQWLRRNWARLNHFSPVRLEGRNQTTQAPYCAAYLSVLATKYGSFIPALSEHNAGGTNVGRTLITGEYLGGDDVRERYLLGSQLARDLRARPGREFRDVYRSYGPRSHLYAEMVFGNTFIVRELLASTPQAPIHAMRTTRALRLAEIRTHTGLSADDIRRFNPALHDVVPARTVLYLPSYVSEFGADVAFWRRPADASFAAVLDDFLHLEPGAERWDDPGFAPVLGEFRRRFRATDTEEGLVMDTVLAYVMDQAYTSGRRALVAEFQSSERVRSLIQGRLQ